ncbi:Translation release factor eRF1 [Schizosaccharomyces pombe]|uniref:Eukaryotic peptide chain release factor subunit 1 n=2 Tax=Schizosaccharomyces pombe TaxID=4896 RepID=ERF1_SCHPO|nr:translation release factor eRF1 [Schizosaccharomyces pombe]P79063.1 RecName: Full=Eukaryotic peptide chain release factor subunit 1; Short=Eukaryotic release factor 1; Short=eRF1 [Schizosaccharomyces pombe 972h-]BAA09933.1 sup45 [Schizosaccharomyces pombe]CAB75769.1 translation release factor eRF1 [Schizosaccharomyces pombe]|eukprot:NP_594680.1 translation release factor eRF1 [Schizosaccharomyces pombe]
MSETAEKAIEIWKIRRLVKQLINCHGNGTSMITLIIPPGEQISRYSNMLAEEYGTASNIKSRVNRLSVLSAITSTRERLKLYNKVPDNGLVIYCGEVIMEGNKTRKLNIDFEPFKPINTSQYLCDNKFHTEALAELLESDQRFGFIVMDGHQTLYGVVSGSAREVLQRFTVDLPKKHGRGGQSALRFARLRDEKRHNYVRKVAEGAVQHFITDDKPNVAGIVLAGSADFKTELGQSDLFDQRLQSRIIKTVDVSYGGDAGFNQAIELAADTLSNVKYVQEKKLIQRFFDEISLDSGKYCFGVVDTMNALQEGAVETLLCFADLDMIRYEFKNSEGNPVITYMTKEQEEKDSTNSFLLDKDTGAEMELVSSMLLSEWLAEHYKDYGANLEFVSDRSQEGMQFVKGFGGIGAVMRYQLDLSMLDPESDEFYSDSD